MLDQLRPLSARSLVLSLLLGSHPAEVPVRALVPVAELHGVSSATLRVALSRMVSAGDLVRTDATYRLSDRLLARQERQDRELTPAPTSWNGSWHQVVVTATGRDAVRRHDLRRELLDARHAELREGVWLRPDNLAPSEWSPATCADTVMFTARPDDDPAALAARLWDLTGWSAQGTALAAALAEAAEPARRLTVAAAVVRHLRTDPQLPTSLLPEDWPGDQLRKLYADYRAELGSLLNR